MLDLVWLEINGLEFEIRENTWDDTVLKDEITENIYSIKKPKIVVDIGAHIGGTTIYCASLGAKVYAYEPSRINYHRLLRHIDLNDLQDNVVPFNLGIGDGEPIKLYHHPTNYGCFSKYIDNSDGMIGESEIVETITIKDVFKDIEHCDLLKVDCEGAEAEFYKYIPVDKIDQISMELHGRKEKEIIDFLSNFYNIGIKKSVIVCQKK